MKRRLPDAQQHEPKKGETFLYFIYFEKDTKIGRNLKILFEITSRFHHTFVVFSEYVNYERIKKNLLWSRNG